MTPMPRRVDKRTILGAQFLAVGLLSALPPASLWFTGLLVGVGAYLAFGRARRSDRSVPAQFLLRAK